MSAYKYEVMKLFKILNFHYSNMVFIYNKSTGVNMT